jgi:hypothetical protein
MKKDRGKSSSRARRRIFQIAAAVLLLVITLDVSILHGPSAALASVRTRFVTGRLLRKNSHQREQVTGHDFSHALPESGKNRALAPAPVPDERYPAQQPAGRGFTDADARGSVSAIPLVKEASPRGGRNSLVRGGSHSEEKDFEPRRGETNPIAHSSSRVLATPRNSGPRQHASAPDSTLAKIASSNPVSVSTATESARSLAETPSTDSPRASLASITPAALTLASAAAAPQFAQQMNFDPRQAMPATVTQGQAPLSVGYQKHVEIAITGATAAYSLNPEIADAASENGLGQIIGASPGTTNVVIVTQSGIQTIAVHVPVPPPVVLPGFESQDSGAAGESGVYELR